MYKVLLVDDERTIVEGISQIVDWENQGVTLAGTAGNGLEAMHFISKHRPDIVISDIRMPGLDGIELIQKSSRLFPSMKWIFLSGFNEFDYARQVMRYGVRHYLLKPCNEKTITSALREIVQELRQQQRQGMYVKRLEAQLNKLQRDPERASSNSRAYSPTVRKMMVAVQENLDNPHLSLQWLASEKLYMNADYLGKLFKKEVGEKFSTYVARERVEAAIKMMAQEDDLKVFELAERVGYGHNPQYFSRLFKNIAGCSPSELMKSPE